MISEVNYPCRSVSDFHVGQVIERKFSLNKDDLKKFVEASGDNHPLHTNSEFSISQGFPDVVLNGMCISSRCSSFIAKEIVGSHGLLISMNSDFMHPGFCDELFRWRAEVIQMHGNRLVEIEWEVINQNEVAIQRGTATAYYREVK